jgi:spermidine synthase
VQTRDGRRTLAFENGEIQSEMRLSRPDALVLAYARAMMCFALFAPRPRHIVMVGLGGGSLVKFCYRCFPAARITVLEISADVIALRAAFQVPPDDARLRVIHADGAAWMQQASNCADVVLVDGFDAGGMPAALGSAAFYQACRRALTEDGVLVANLLGYDPRLAAILADLDAAFDGRSCDFPGIAGNNHLRFAVRTDGRGGHAAGLQVRLARWRALQLRWLNPLLARALVAWLARRRV